MFISKLNCLSCIQRIVKAFIADIAYLKEALRTWKGIKSPEAVESGCLQGGTETGIRTG